MKKMIKTGIFLGLLLLSCSVSEAGVWAFGPTGTFTGTIKGDKTGIMFGGGALTITCSEPNANTCFWGDGAKIYTDSYINPHAPTQNTYIFTDMTEIE